MGTSALAPVVNVEPVDQVGSAYRETLTFVERLHRRLLDVIWGELDKTGAMGVNPVQALLLYNVGDKELTASELRTRGCYLGSNISYNVKKLNEEGFVEHRRSRADRRAVCISLTEKGRVVHDLVARLFDNQVGGLVQDDHIATTDLATLNKALVRLERFWTDQIMYRL
jgi:DNA-binding MarR family transcriptional regulator